MNALESGLQNGLGTPQKAKWAWSGPRVQARLQVPAGMGGREVCKDLLLRIPLLVSGQPGKGLGDAGQGIEDTYQQG